MFIMISLYIEKNVKLTQKSVPEKKKNNLCTLDKIKIYFSEIIGGYHPIKAIKLLILKQFNIFHRSLTVKFCVQTCRWII